MSNPIRFGEPAFKKLHYGYYVEMDREGFYRIVSPRVNVPVPQKVYNFKFTDEEEAILALYKYSNGGKTAD